MKTKNQVIEFIKDQSNYGNAILYATIGNGGAGLTISSYDFSEDLEGIEFDGIAVPCDDIKNSTYFDYQYNSVYQFSDENGFIIQVVTF